ncbi:hypothetical protein NDU88_003915 [Pleurodeles waltl]|uniref:Uncharacterized protein n=1 Tax=Pleurodeles waltl TaxID=8319 RepID=A0AAV7UFQ2_PLEWA|nr:hypothetical protein NDU88_003915 [Pleurodeles waltl]
MKEASLEDVWVQEVRKRLGMVKHSKAAGIAKKSDTDDPTLVQILQETKSSRSTEEHKIDTNKLEANSLQADLGKVN